MIKQLSLRCDECGRFISYSDILDELALHRLITPESLTSKETFETLCKNHWWKSELHSKTSFILKQSQYHE